MTKADIVSEISKKTIMDDLVRLDEAISAKKQPQELISLLREMIPTYHDPKEVNRCVAPPEVLEKEDEVDSEAYPRKVEESS